jgi:trehalose synthase
MTCYQISDGENGFLVNSIDEAANRIVTLLQTPELRQRMGASGRETVRRKFLLSRLAEDWIDLITARRAAMDT